MKHPDETLSKPLRETAYGSVTAENLEKSEQICIILHLHSLKKKYFQALEKYFLQRCFIRDTTSPSLIEEEKPASMDSFNKKKRKPQVERKAVACVTSSSQNYYCFSFLQDYNESALKLDWQKLAPQNQFKVERRRLIESYVYQQSKNLFRDYLCQKR